MSLLVKQFTYTSKTSTKKQENNYLHINYFLFVYYFVTTCPSVFPVGNQVQLELTGGRGESVASELIIIYPSSLRKDHFP